MKKFIDSKGQFYMEVPLDWGYMNPLYQSGEESPSAFELYEDAIGSFQITYKPIDFGNVPKLIEDNNLPTQEANKDGLQFKESFISLKFEVYMWMAVVEDTFFLCKYIYKKNCPTAKIKEELAKVRYVLSTIVFIPKDIRNVILSSERFDKFMTSLFASSDLSNRAYANGSHIELVILLANQIDAALRLALLLKKQLNEKSNLIDTKYIYQGNNETPIMEKAIYKKALEENIITQDIYNELFSLYNQRNKVVHRYIITDLRTNDIIRIVSEYNRLKEVVGEEVKKLEIQQYKYKIGVYGSEAPPNTPLSNMQKEILIGGLREKHANEAINDEITFKKDT